MSKTVRERKLDSPAARAKLKASGKPYGRSLDPGIHLGYRKGKRVFRRYLGGEKYSVETIRTADDHSGRRWQRHIGFLPSAAKGPQDCRGSQGASRQ